MKNSSIVSSKIGFFFIISLKKTRLGVCSSVCFSWKRIDPKIILAKLLRPLDLAKTQALCIHEMTKIVIIVKNKDLVFTTF